MDCPAPLALDQCHHHINYLKAGRGAPSIPAMSTERPLMDSTLVCSPCHQLQKEAVWYRHAPYAPPTDALSLILDHELCEIVLARRSAEETRSLGWEPEESLYVVSVTQSSLAKPSSGFTLGLLLVSCSFDMLSGETGCHFMSSAMINAEHCVHMSTCSCMMRCSEQQAHQRCAPMLSV